MEPHGRAVMDISNPASGEVVAHVTLADEEPIVKAGADVFLSAQNALHELPLTRELGRDNGHPGACWRCRSDYPVERERTFPLHETCVSRRFRLYGAHEAQRAERSANAGLAGARARGNPPQESLQRRHRSR